MTLADSPVLGFRARRFLGLTHLYLGGLGRTRKGISPLDCGWEGVASHTWYQFGYFLLTGQEGYHIGLGPTPMTLSQWSL